MPFRNERWIFVHWIETDNPSVIEKEWLIAKRNQLTGTYYGDDDIDLKFMPPVYEEVDFLGRRAGKMSGLWKSEKEIRGGPFILYGFYDVITERIYLLDFSLFDPRLNKQKRKLIRDGEVILHTFGVVGDRIEN